MWAPWKEWAARRAETEHDRKLARRAVETATSEERHAEELARRLKESSRRGDPVADRVERAFRARPPREDDRQ